MRNEAVDRTEPLQFLLANELIGETWPLTEQLHPDLKKISSGKCMILIVRQNCDHCQELVSKHFAVPESHRPGERTAVFVAGHEVWRFQWDRIAFDLPNSPTLSWDSGEPFVAAPAVFLVDNGVVVQAADGNDSAQFLETALNDRKQ